MSLFTLQTAVLNCLKLANKFTRAKNIAIFAFSLFLIACPGLQTKAAELNFSGLTYTADIAPILKAHCVTCHNTMAMIPDFSKYQGVYELREKILDRVYAKKNMPPGNLSKMSDEERELIALWIDEGAVE